MSINLSIPQQTTQELRPRITVVGVGGGGCNAVNNMIDAALDGVDFLVANTDGQSLAHSKANRKVQLGSQLTGGLGAGSKPEIGRLAAEESIEDIMAELSDCNMVFVTAGMGGGTGTGAAPVIAKAARDRGILTVGVVTKPFQFEGKRRMEQADEGVRSLQDVVDTLIVIPNQNLFSRANEQTRLADAFSMADTVLHQGVCGVTDLMIKPGLINLDFADIRAVMLEMGKAMMGTGEASGEGRAIAAAEDAINNPLLDHSSMHGAKALLINITGGMDMTLFEVDEAANRIRQEVDEDASIIFGSAFDETMEGVMRISVVATGIDAKDTGRTITPERDVTPTAVFTPQLPVAPTPSFQPRADAQPLASSTAEHPPAAAVAQTAVHTEAVEQAEMPVSPQTDISAPSTGEHTVMQDATEQTQTDAPTVQTPTAEQLDLEAVARERTEQVAKKLEEIKAEADDGSASEPTALTDDTPSEPSKPELSHAASTIIRRPAFVPSQTQQPAQPQTPEQTASIPQTSRPSLINKISRMWQTKEGAEQTAQETKSETAQRETPLWKRSEAVLPRVEEPAIMDLPKTDMVQPSLNISPSAPASSASEDDDDMDIPAFLRRQAN